VRRAEEGRTEIYGENGSGGGGAQELASISHMKILLRPEPRHGLNGRVNKPENINRNKTIVAK
jgi:hypothetical protein